MPTRVKVISFSVKNYKSIKSCDLDFSKDVVGLIGENATGKSNIGRAITAYFTLIRDFIPSQIGDQEWEKEKTKGYKIRQTLPPDKFNPYALHRNPSIGQTIEFSGKFSLNTQTHQGGSSGQEANRNNVTSPSSDRNLEIRFLLELNPTGDGDGMAFQPYLWIRLDGKIPPAADFKNLSIWKQFQGDRVKAVRPFLDISNEMNTMKNIEQILQGLRIDWTKPKKFHAENCTVLYKLGNKMAQVIFPNGGKTRKPIEGKGFCINGVDASWFLQCPEKYMPHP